ncbi:hypothetical protein Vafri_18977 [Volvox africanus]|uniref:Protein kinase domain-containing protein n=1 Tax=Volvox africanus TaxID=51714 RepID=A0A8J4BPB0_9CHLO|nr:hypothetical protein Vafri_18977 [Volvox africanus]
MGLCLCKSVEDRSDANSRDSSRKRSRSGFGPAGNRQYSERGGSSRHARTPDFGINSHYRVMELLGEGGTGQTWLCQDLKSHRRVAIKFIPRPLAKVLVPMVSQEIQLQAQLSEGHLGLVRVESALLSKSHLGLVMEYIDGGTLTQYVTKRACNKGERGGLHLTEDEARYFFKQLVAAVEYLHASHVAHRDLKMCNVVLTQRRPPTLKLCDFGFAKGWDDSSMMHTRIGTPVYMSPQLIASKTDGKTYSATAADVWACGVMLFAMLLGRFPYDHVGHPDPNSSGAHFEVWTEQMKASNGDWQATPRVAPHINLLTEECKDLLGKMLDTEEKQRITIPEIRKHAWFTTELPPYLYDALQECEERQARLAKVMEAATEAQIKRRNKAVHDLIVMAGQPCNNIDQTRRNGSGPISAIFEVGTDCDAASVASTGNNAQSPTHAASLRTSPNKAPGNDVRAAAMDMGSPHSEAVPVTASSSDGRARGEEPEVIMVELAAVAKRTKSDGLVLMSGLDADVAAGGRNCNSDNSDSSGDQVAETRCTGGGTASAATTAVGGSSSREGYGQSNNRSHENATSASVTGAAMENLVLSNLAVSPKPEAVVTAAAGTAAVPTGKEISSTANTAPPTVGGKNVIVSSLNDAAEAVLDAGQITLAPLAESATATATATATAEISAAAPVRGLMSPFSMQEVQHQRLRPQ